MLIGAHVVIYSKDPGADRDFLRDVLKLAFVDGGGSYLIFGLPPAEASVHLSSNDNLPQELYLQCEDVEAFIADMRHHDVACAAVQNTGWGLLTQVTLPGGGKLGVYQPQHTRPDH